MILVNSVYGKPFPSFLLYNLMPITRLDNSTNWVTFSDGFSETNGPKAALGITLSKAAATSILIWKTD